MSLRCARWSDLDPVTAHDVLRLRVDVFVVEQRCPYPEIDGRDVDHTTEHRWACSDVSTGSAQSLQAAPSKGSGPTVLAYLRVLDSGAAVVRIGRVCAYPDARGTGVARALMAAAVADHDADLIVLDAQRPLTDWYAGFGFVPDGPGFVEDGIPHVPMRRGPGGVAR